MTYKLSPHVPSHTFSHQTNIIIPIEYELLINHTENLYKIVLQSKKLRNLIKIDPTYIEDLKQEIRYFILKNWDENIPVLYNKFRMWLAVYRTSSRYGQFNYNNFTENEILNKNQISPFTYLECKTQIESRLGQTKNNQLNQTSWLQGIYQNFEIITPQTEYELLVSSVEFQNVSQLAKNIQQKKSNVVFLKNHNQEIGIILNQNKDIVIIQLYNIFWDDTDRSGFSNFLENYKSNMDFWDFINTGKI